MNLRLIVSCLLILPLGWSAKAYAYTSNNDPTDTVITVRGMNDNKISVAWQHAVADRVSRSVFDSMVVLRRAFTKEEMEWEQLIRFRARRWNGFRDSLLVPFGSIPMKDTIEVLLGGFGVDDAFTYKDHTVCFDLTALFNNYGLATLPVNTNRMDRLFAHEFTHLVHKEWAARNKLQLKNFRDSILWECLYEGMGMYRSLSDKWMPRNGVLPEITQTALKNLIPVFVDRMIAIHRDTILNPAQQNVLHAGLSRGPVDKKWGAFPVGIWLALEAGGDDRKLLFWIQRGPEGVLLLADKYMSQKEKERFRL